MEQLIYSRKNKNIVSLTVSALLLSLFFIASNILPPVFVLPGIPFTLQIFIVALMGFLLGLKRGLICISALFMLTAAGIPMMSGFRGGIAVFVSPTGGFIIGFIFIAAISGVYSDIFKKNSAFSFTILLLMSVLGLLIDYSLGAYVLSVQSGKASFYVLLYSNMIFLPFDVVKIVAAAAVSFYIKKTTSFNLN